MSILKIENQYYNGTPLAAGCLWQACGGGRAAEALKCTEGMGDESAGDVRTAPTEEGAGHNDGKMQAEFLLSSFVSLQNIVEKLQEIFGWVSVTET